MSAQEKREAFKTRIAGLRIDELILLYPKSKPVLYNHFGASCFSCPGSSQETVAFGVRVHDSQPEEFFDDLAEALEIELDKSSNP